MIRISIAPCLTLAVVLLSLGCGGTTSTGIDPGGGAVSRSVVTVRPTVQTEPVVKPGDGVEKPGVGSAVPGALTGQIVFDGPVPKPNALVQKGVSKVDPLICAHEADIPDESLLVSAGGGIGNVFVYLDKAPEWYKAKPSAETLLDQKACLFRPHAVIVPVGVEFLLRNSDTVAHNIKTEPAFNDTENNTMKPGSEMTMRFKRPERMPFQSKCAIHPWMEFYTLTLSHPFAAITDLDGKFEIKDLMPGKYKLRVWHERARTLDPVTIEIKGGESRELPLKYKAAVFGS